MDGGGGGVVGQVDSDGVCLRDNSNGGWDSIMVVVVMLMDLYTHKYFNRGGSARKKVVQVEQGYIWGQSRNTKIISK